jgi:hypothetical protein
MQEFAFKYRRPLQVNDLQYLREFEPISGASQLIEDKKPRREFTITAFWTNLAEYKLLRKFVQDHYKKQPFLFKGELDGKSVQVFLTSPPTWARGLGIGEVQLTFQEANAMPTDWQNPTVPGLTLTGRSGRLIVSITSASTDNVGVDRYEIEIRPPELVP